MEGVIFNIQRFSVQDGPGIRTTVFFKGCPLRCRWCHNPESQHTAREIAYHTDKCIGCGACGAVCPSGAHRFEEGRHVFLRERCTACGRCAEVCCAQALEAIGRRAPVEEVLREVLADKEFYAQSGGGMTLSGGEPLAQPEFATALARAAKEAGVSVCVETCGYADPAILLRLAEFTDIFLFDYKLTDPEKHKAFTGVSNEKILSNLEELDRNGVQTILRCPMIPEVNLEDSHFEGIARQANRLQHCLGIDLEPYHPLGISKSEQLGRQAAYQRKEFLNRDDLLPAAETLRRSVSIPVKIL